MSLTAMPQRAEKHNAIRRIVHIRHMLMRWRTKAASRKSVPSDVPSGHVAVSVGGGCRRFIVPATHLNHPIFKALLEQAEDEYGFGNRGPLALPCDVAVFERILRVVDRSDLGDRERCCHVGESERLLMGFGDEEVF